MTEYDAIFGRAADGQASALSAEGLERRAAMRDQLMGAVVSRRRRRTATRWGSALAAAVVLVSLAWPRAVVLPDPGLEIADAEAPAAMTDYREVRDDADVLARYGVAQSEPELAVFVDDAELLELLEGANRATGIIRSGDRCVLTRDVTDPIGE